MFHIRAADVYQAYFIWKVTLRGGLFSTRCMRLLSPTCMYVVRLFRNWKRFLQNVEYCTEDEAWGSIEKYRGIWRSFSGTNDNVNVFLCKRNRADPEHFQIGIDDTMADFPWRSSRRQISLFILSGTESPKRKKRSISRRSRERERTEVKLWEERKKNLHLFVAFL